MTELDPPNGYLAKGDTDDGAALPPEPWAEPARAVWLSRDRWLEVGGESWGPALLILFGAWLLMAWNRLGLQGFSAPRIGVRYLLVGFYGWVGMTVVIIGLARLTGVDRRADPLTLARVVGRTHQPMVIVGFLVQITQVLPIQIFSTVAVAIVFGFWMPGQLLVGSAATFDAPTRRLVIPVLVAYGLWLLIVGRFLLGQLGHLF